MTIAECIKKNGWQYDLSVPFSRYQTVDVDFTTHNGINERTDETQYDISGAGTTKGVKELSSLFEDFCKENGFNTDTVISVTVIAAADTLEEL